MGRRIGTTSESRCRCAVNLCPECGPIVRISDTVHILDGNASSASNPGACRPRAHRGALRVRTRWSSQSRRPGARALVGDGSLRSARTRRLRDLGRRPIFADRPSAGSSKRGLVVSGSWFSFELGRGTGAALTPSSMQPESNQEAAGRPCSLGRLRSSSLRCATWSHLPGPDATALSGSTPGSRTRIHALQVDQYPAAVRDWISLPCGSRSRREVDPS